MSITLEATEKSYGSGFTLGPITTTIGRGVTCLIGANGAGKSTLIRLLSGTEHPTAGRVTLTIAGSTAAVASQRGRIGYMPQEFAFPGRATCYDFLYYTAWLRKVGKADRTGAVTRCLDEVGLGDRAAAAIRTLSGGMRRRLCLAQALVHDPPVLLLDEPTAGLDPVQRVAIRDVVAALAGDRTVVYSTHLVEDIRGLDGTVMALRDGQVTFRGTHAELAASVTRDGSLEQGLLQVLGV
ncbi:ABC transporter ATP-binding protein [Micromonospora sediminicola]|uniref:ABC transporter ATP-binding protein n=1 Tax=Micromonospora sediminicola TaxID=946078 RepID=UPI00378E1787